MATTGLGCDNIGPFAQRDVEVVSRAVPVPLAAVAVAVVSGVVAAVVAVAVVVVVAAAAAAAAVAVDLWIESVVNSAKEGRRGNLSERHGTVRPAASDSVVDRRTPTWMEKDKNVVKDRRSVDVFDCWFAATSPVGRTEDMAATALTEASCCDPDD